MTLNQANGLYIGNILVKKVYLGTKLVWQVA